MRKLSQKYAAHITVQEQQLPVEIVIEPRNGSRYSMTRKRIIMRLPTGTTAEGVHKELQKLQDWVLKISDKKPTLLAPYTAKKYENGSEIKVGVRQYFLQIDEDDRATHSARLVGNTIALQLSTRSTPAHRDKSIRTLLSRVIAGDFHRDIADRVHAINRRTFNRPIKNIYLKYNHSNWGSCSSDGNVNLSTRLLFAPIDVQDYVIVHELAHLVELNHSDRFWALVEAHIPNYTEKEQWLKLNGALCDF